MTQSSEQLTILQSALHKLGDELCHLVVREHQILQEEMNQVRALVGEAVKSINSNFRSLNARAAEQADILDEVAKTGRIDELQQKKITEISKEMSSHTSSTIRTLQFDDIVQQLAGHTCERIARMQELFAELDGKLTEIKQMDAEDGVAIQLRILEMYKEVGLFRTKLEKENPVKQSTMEAGKIELF